MKLPITGIIRSNLLTTNSYSLTLIKIKPAFNCAYYWAYAFCPRLIKFHYFIAITHLHITQCNLRHNLHKKPKLVGLSIYHNSEEHDEIETNVRAASFPKCHVMSACKLLSWALCDRRKLKNISCTGNQVTFKSFESWWLIKDGAYYMYCYCAYVLRISRYSDLLWVVLINPGIFLRGSKLRRESRT